MLALKEAGCERIYGDKITGTSDWDARPELQKCLEEMVEGDLLVISELSRYPAPSLAWSTRSATS